MRWPPWRSSWTGCRTPGTAFRSDWTRTHGRSYDLSEHQLLTATDQHSAHLHFWITFLNKFQNRSRVWPGAFQQPYPDQGCPITHFLSYFPDRVQYDFCVQSHWQRFLQGHRWPNKNRMAYFSQYVDAITVFSRWGIFSWAKRYQDQQFWFSSFVF